MQGYKRLLVQATLYEGVAIAFIAPGIMYIYKEDFLYSTGLSISISIIAVCWNILVERLFNAWEFRQVQQRRSFLRRVAHATCFEGGLTILLLPLLVYSLDLSWIQGLKANLGLFMFYFVYALCFQWCFDKLFNQPQCPEKLSSKAI